MIKKFCVIIVSVTILIGCGETGKPLYEGMPLKTWVERLAAPETEIRLDALDVIKSIGVRGRPAESYVLEVAREDPSPQVRMAAIETLESMEVPIVEFADFLDLYYSPLIPMEDSEMDYYEEDDEDDLSDHISGAKDLEYLQMLESADGDMQAEDTVMIPSDPEKLAKWTSDRTDGAMADIMKMLDNPVVLGALLNKGDYLERVYAAKKLSNFSGTNQEIVNSLERLLNEPDSTIVKAATEALKQWARP